MIYAAILAGGKGTRMGGDLPKQFLEINDVPIVVRTVRAFLNCGFVDQIVLCVPCDFIDYTREVLNRYPDTFGKTEIIEGGADRTGSLENACRYFDGLCSHSPDDVLITHDCVRPFVTNEMISSSVEAARKYGGATAAVPSVDTICCSNDGKTIDNVPDRSKLFSVQTPQTFMLGEFCKILYSLSNEEKGKVTDASAVFRMRGKTVALSLGSPSNIKITHPNDLPFAERLAETY